MCPPLPSGLKTKPKYPRCDCCWWFTLAHILPHIIEEGFMTWRIAQPPEGNQDILVSLFGSSCIVNFPTQQTWEWFPTIKLSLWLSSETALPTGREEDDRENDQRHNTQDHHHGNSYALPVPWGAVWTPQVLIWKERNTATNVVVDENISAAGAIVSGTDVSPWHISPMSLKRTVTGHQCQADLAEFTLHLLFSSEDWTHSLHQ